MKSIRRNKKKTAFFLLSTFVFQMVPMDLLALTGGPSQPEVESFQPIGVSDMVDLFSGNFQYNLPLLDVDGYPLNLAYSGDITSDAEASWVGLGWNLNTGAITRSMRGVPDEFKGDIITKQTNLKPNKTISITGGTELEKFGSQKINTSGQDSSVKTTKYNASLTLSYNNYTGFGLSTSISGARTLSKFIGGEKTSESSQSLSLSSSDQGLGISPNASFAKIKKDKDRKDITKSLNIGFDYNSRAGLQSLSFGLKRNKLAVAAGEALNIGLESYTPYVETPMNNTSMTFTFKTGGEFIGIFPNSSISGTYSWQRLKDKIINIRAFGYNNTHEAFDDGEEDLQAMLDVNREKDGSFNKNTPMLPITNYTYDLYNVNGQGISGTFRPFRSEIGNLYDRSSDNTSVGVSPGFETGVGNLTKYGMDINVNFAYSTNGKWKDHYNDAGRKFFVNKIDRESVSPDYEPYAFRQLGEMTIDDESYVKSNYSGTEPLRNQIALADITYRTMPSLLDKYNVQKPYPTRNHREHRIKRNQLLSVLNREEVERFGVENFLNITYPANAHHPAEMTVIKDDGARYVFGIAAYNHKQEETSFSVGPRGKDVQDKIGMELDIDRNSGLVLYDSKDNSMDNDRGLDNYYSNTITPHYAHSYLLTCILSTDYVDIDGVRGPSKGDIGNYTKFSYEKVNSLYKWRVPFEQYKANFNEGLNADLDDNQANYTYGEKELWYLNKIETKNSIAILELEDRKDGFGVIDHNGGIGDVSTKLLRKITLYSKKDYDLNGAGATPIKVVNFEYSYELCPGVPNNNGSTSGPDDNTAKGKLTLKKVYFTYGTSLRGKFSPYTFEYNDGDMNPGYGLKNNDRWGNYKPNDPNLYNSEYPYVDQDKSLVDEYCQAWLLKSITLPSGGVIEVEYESDDYAFVQDKRAMQMFKIYGFCTGEDRDDIFNTSSSAYKKRMEMMKESPAVVNRQYLVFELTEPVTISGNNSSDQDLFRRKYLQGIENLYFRIKVDVVKREALKDKNRNYEYVSGYCELESIYDIDNAFMLSDGTISGKYTHGYVMVKNVKIGDKASLLNVHPMCRAAWQFGRQRLSKEIYGGVTDYSTNGEKLLNTFFNASFIRPIFQKLQGQNGFLMNTNCGKEIDLDRSFVRLYNPNGFKYGGGSRVKKITISDRWNNMIPSGTSNDESIYGQEYDYRTHDPELNRWISSGVASFEPGVGADENPLKQPIFFGDKPEKLLASNDKSYLEAPVGESFYPTPGIGYSKVTVRNLRHTNVNRHATGYVENEFYTAKDFPVITQITPLEVKQTVISPLLKAFKRFTRNYTVASQGFSIELNDMHGKPKAVWVYSEDSKVPISGTEYKYKCKPHQTDPISGKSYMLTNDVQVVYPDGRVDTKELGVEYDMVNDYRQETTTSFSGSGDVNFDAFTVGILSIFPSFFAGIDNDRQGFRSAVTTKVINRYGIVEEVIAHDLGSKVGTKNLAYDSETGNVLLTQTKNEFEDDIYSFTYPAHWYYDGMGHAYKNYKMWFTHQDFDADGRTEIENAENWFVIGDEIIAGTEKGWVSEIDGNLDKIKVINELGKPFKPLTNDNEIKIIRSGRRNILQANIGSIVSMSNPLNGIRNNSFSKVVNASNQVFRDDWKTYCECFEGESDFMKISSNPYATGRKGIWRPFKSFTYLTNREISIRNSNTNIRHDGTFVNYSPFWKWNDGYWGIDDVGWTWTSEITEYSPFGMELENRDPLNRYSAATYGYNNSLPLSVAANARYAEIGFDGFEDYDFSNCTNDHFSYRANAIDVTETSSHTGKKSIRVNSSSDVKISKPIENCVAP